MIIVIVNKYEGSLLLYFLDIIYFEPALLNDKLAL